MGPANTVLVPQSHKNQAGIASSPVAVGRNVSRIRKTSISVIKLSARSLAVFVALSGATIRSTIITLRRNSRVVVVHNLSCQPFICLLQFFHVPRKTSPSFIHAIFRTFRGVNFAQPLGAAASDDGANTTSQRVSFVSSPCSHETFLAP